jgi:hypothetical protein
MINFPPPPPGTPSGGPLRPTGGRWAVASAAPPGFPAAAGSLATGTTPPAYPSPVGARIRGPVTFRRSARFVFAKSLLFYGHSANQRIATPLAGSYVDPQGTK